MYCWPPPSPVAVRSPSRSFLTGADLQLSSSSGPETTRGKIRCVASAQCERRAGRVRISHQSSSLVRTDRFLRVLPPGAARSVRAALSDSADRPAPTVRRRASASTLPGSRVLPARKRAVARISDSRSRRRSMVSSPLSPGDCPIITAGEGRANAAAHQRGATLQC